MTDKEKELIMIAYSFRQDEIQEAIRLNKPIKEMSHANGWKRSANRPFVHRSNILWKEKRLFENIKNILLGNKKKLIKDPHNRYYIGGHVFYLDCFGKLFIDDCLLEDGALKWVTSGLTSGSYIIIREG